LVATEYDLAPGINVCGEADEKVPAVAFWKRMSARAPKPAPRRRVRHLRSAAHRGVWTRILVVIAAVLLAGCSSSARTNSTTTASTGNTTSAQAEPAQGDIPTLVRQVEPSVVTVLTDTGLGSGIVYKADGTIVTDAHVVANAHQVTVAFADGQQLLAKVRAADPVSDVAVVQANRTGLTPASFEKALPQVGALAVVIGSPLGLEATVTSGIISGLHREIPGSAAGAPLVDLIQTDAPISPGNSGGALLDGQGHVVGVSEAYVSPTAGAVALGFATPAATVVDVADQLLASGTAHHAYIGIQPGTLTPQIAQQLGVNRNSGVVVLQVAPDGPAQTAGIRIGDVIIALNGQDTPTAERFTAAIHAAKPGDKIQLTVQRGGATVQLTVTVADRPTR
jgi:serine protease DegQ